MKSYHVNILNSALYDISDIYKNILNFSGDVSIAVKQRERILKAINKLSVSPKIYRVRRKDSFNRGIRYLPVNNYFILYTVYDDEQQVDVLNVIHNKRDIDSLI